MSLTLWGPLETLLQHGKRVFQKPSREQTFHEAKKALGERMVAAGIDDGAIGEQIAALDEEIRQASGGQELRAKREQLILQLAALALEEDAPLPGAAKEYERARKAQAALENRKGILTGSYS